MKLEVNIAKWKVEDFGLKNLKPGLEIDVVLDSGAPKRTDKRVKSLPRTDGTGAVGEVIEIRTEPWILENNKDINKLTMGIIDCGIPIRFQMYSEQTPDIKIGQFVEIVPPILGDIIADYPAWYRSPIKATLLDIMKEGDDYRAKLKLNGVGPLFARESHYDQYYQIKVNKKRWKLKWIKTNPHPV